MLREVSGCAVELEGMHTLDDENQTKKKPTYLSRIVPVITGSIERRYVAVYSVKPCVDMRTLFDAEVDFRESA